MGTSVSELASSLGTPVGQVLALAKAQGRTLYISSGRRTYAEQVALRRAHCGETPYAIYQMPAADCSPPTAKPGQSKHETGQAVDLGGDVEWAAAQLAKLGVGRPVQGEPWHFEVSTSNVGGKVAAAIGNGVNTLLPGAGGLVSGGIGAIRGGAELVGYGATAARTLTDRQTWVRAGWFILGSGLTIAGLVILAGQTSKARELGRAAVAAAAPEAAAAAPPPPPAPKPAAKPPARPSVATSGRRVPKSQLDKINAGLAAKG